MANNTTSNLETLEAFLKDYPGMEYATPSSPNYPSLRTTFLLDFKTVPLAILRPQTEEHVAAIVSYATANNIQFTVRSGGNNLYGLCCVQDALMIDLRDISYVKIDDTKAAARIGGGILLGDLAAALSQEELATAVGTIPFVGYAGWAMYGGYGPFSANYGLGVDNIIGAKVVNWKGEIVEANDEMLKGIRGAGGFIGVIVELKIKVYPLKHILAGMVIFESQDVSHVFQGYNERLNALLAKDNPRELNAQQLVVNSPQGRVFTVSFVWSSEDHEKGQQYLEKIQALGTVLVSTVQSTTVSSNMERMAAVVSTTAYGSVKGVSIRNLTGEATAVIGRNLERMPSHHGVGFVIHDLRGPSATPKDNSVFGSRECHFLLELISTTLRQEDREEGLNWIDNFWNDLQTLDQENVLKETYISLTPPHGVELPKTYGRNYDVLLELKRKFDPQNIFKLAVPRIQEQ